MLKQMIFAPCERVIIAKDDIISLISVMETVQISVTADLPTKALAPIGWAIVSLWRRDENTDAPIEFEERTEVIWQDGTVALGGTTRFTVTNSHLMYRSLISFPAFPIGQAGMIWIKNRIRQTNPETEWVASSEFPLVVIHLPMTPSDVTPETSAEQPQLPTS
jgi:hypothetical protein